MSRAIAEGLRLDNPAGDEIVEGLSPHNTRQQHHRSLHHSQVREALAAFHASQAMPATKLAMEFLTLTACRPGEVSGCRWEEIDLEAATWTLPPGRTKTSVQHRVPLSARAVELLHEARELSDGNELVFPGRDGGMLSDGTLTRRLQHLGIDCTPHGMRSSFRSWCSDTGQTRELAEMALGHAVRGVEAAYARSDMLERRRPLMERWADYLR